MNNHHIENLIKTFLLSITNNDISTFKNILNSEEFKNVSISKDLILETIKQNKIDFTRLLINDKRINLKKELSCLLSSASYIGNLEAVEVLLLNENFHTPKQSETAFLTSIKQGETKIVNAFINAYNQKGFNVSSEALILAFHYRKTDIIKLFINNSNADLCFDNYYYLVFSARHKYLEGLKALSQHEQFKKLNINSFEKEKNNPNIYAFIEVLVKQIPEVKTQVLKMFNSEMISLDNVKDIIFVNNINLF